MTRYLIRDASIALPFMAASAAYATGYHEIAVAIASGFAGFAVGFIMAKLGKKNS